MVEPQQPHEPHEPGTEERAREAHPLYLEIETKVELPRAVDGRRATMHVLCDFTRRLTKSEARHLAESLPREVQPIIEACVFARGEEPDHFTMRELLERVGKDLYTHEPEPIVRTVIEVVQRYLRPEVIDHVSTQLPADLRELWTHPAAPARGR